MITEQERIELEAENIGLDICEIRFAPDIIRSTRMTTPEELDRLQYEN